MERLAVMAALAAPLWLASLGSVAAALPQSSNQTTSRAASKSPDTHEEARGGCGSRGGPGYRKSDGKCAGWDD